MAMTSKRPKYVSPLLCWDIYSEQYDKLIQKARIDFDLKQLRIALNGHLERWIFDRIMEEGYDALVVTDALQKIEWVSRGFSEMTGYPKCYAIGKTPRFLQGPKTSIKTRKSIRERLKKKKVIKDTILNYRKNGEEYLCQIKIIPLFNDENRPSHYLAVERELKAV